MAGTVYALVVGIDRYPVGVPTLSGCVNDATSWAELLEARAGGNLKLRILKDDAASRKAIIAGFTEHLSHAKKGDAAVFIYAGHGSQERAAKEFWQVETDHLLETIVCHDSRVGEGRDLADKELAYLLRETGKKGSHVCVILDCCHSGSGTRALAGPRVRRAPIDSRERALKDFIVPTDQLLQRGTRGISGLLGESAHVLLAACRDEQEAKEYEADRPRGAFSYFLQQAIIDTNGGASYRGLVSRAATLVQAHVVDQHPQLESLDAGLLDQPFLGGTVPPAPTSFTATKDANGQWTMPAGIVHGIAAPTQAGATTVALFPSNASAKDVAKGEGVAATARCVSVTATTSTLELSGTPTLAAKTYQAVVVSMPPASALHVQLTGDAAASARVRTAVGKAAPGGMPSTSVIATDGTAPYRIVASQNEYRIERTDTGREVTLAVSDWTDESAMRAVRLVEHIARWEQLARLSNPATRIPEDALELTLLAGATGETQLDGTEVRLSYTTEGNTEVAPKFRVRLRNRWDRPLHVAIFSLGERFDVSAGLLPAGVVKLEPGVTCFARDGKAVDAYIPKAFGSDVTEVRDVLLALASTTPFDPRPFEQTALAAPARAGIRAIGGVDDDDISDDFTTKKISVTTVRPRRAMTTISSTGSAAVGLGVTVKKHAKFRGTVGLASLPQGTRDVGTNLVPPILADDPAASHVMRFGLTRGNDPGFAVLEIMPEGKDSFSAVTTEAPLDVELPNKVAENETIIATAFDGEFHLPLGHLRADRERNVVSIERLPATGTPSARSISGSIKILFHKLVLRPLGFDYGWPILALATPGPDRTAIYEPDAKVVRARVAAASKVFVFVHGILGDTSVMAASLNTGPDTVVLAFDYENLNTTIEENARLLGERLADVGLGVGHTKQLTLIAHSMGGLVSRHFIEGSGPGLDGRSRVQHLVMLGTPNGGSPWSSAEDWVTGTTALALNGLTVVAWPAKILGAIMSGLERIDNALDEMHPDSAFIKSLRTLPDPGVKYSIIAGNTSIIPAALEGLTTQTSLIDRLFGKLSLKSAFYAAAGITLFRQPNDVAVSVTSIFDVPKNRTSVTQLPEVACDHMSYFSDPAGLNALHSLLGLAPPPRSAAKFVAGTLASGLTAPV